MIHNKPQVSTENEVTGEIQASPDLEDKDDLIICPSLTTTQNRQYTVIIENFLKHSYTLKKGYHFSTFSILRPEQANYVRPIHSAPLGQLVDKNHDYAIQYKSALLQRPKIEETNETYWFLTPQKPGDKTQHTPRQKSKLQELIALQKLEQLNPQDNEESRKQLLSKFDWTDPTSDTAPREAIE